MAWGEMPRGWRRMGGGQDKEERRAWMVEPKKLGKNYRKETSHPRGELSVSRGDIGGGFGGGRGLVLPTRSSCNHCWCGPLILDDITAGDEEPTSG